MIKRVASRYLFLFMVLFGVLFSASASASVQGPVIAQVQTGGSTKATQEFIVIHNNSGNNMDISGWCVVYSSASDATKTPLGCLSSLVLPPDNDVIFASQDFKTAHPDTAAAIIFNAGMNNNGGHLRLFDRSGITKSEVDKVGWGNAISPEALATAAQLSEEPLIRKVDPDFLLRLKDTDNNKLDFVGLCPNVNGNQNYVPEGYMVDSAGNCVVPICPNLKDSSGNYLNYLPEGYKFDGTGINCYFDVCQNTPELDFAIPEGYESTDGLNCTLIPPPPPEDAVLIITELLPNAASTDTGKEFVELYNPNSRAVNLKDYKLELGPGYTKNYLLPDQALGPGAYASFSDTQTGIVLPNTSAMLRLTAPAGNIVSITGSYDSPGDNMAWAVIDNVWQYTNQPTPGAANLPNLEDDNGATGGSGAGTSASEPCPAGKFRNPETNRCKNIEDGAGSLAPCAPDQTRNPETNRCRSIFSATGALTPCQPGQTRNPETNRCRASATTASASLTPCGVGQERNPATNRCRKIGSTAGNLKPCAANQERNPTTNRCRKKLSQTAAGKIKDDEAQQVASTSGWMIVGGTVAAAAGYGVWEWRSEVRKGFQRVRGLFGKSLTDD